jgi:hypothetical protein
VKPITCCSSYVCGRQMAAISAKTVSDMIDRGVSAVWLPVFTHVITMSTVGTYGRFAPNRNTSEWTGPLSWDEAMQLGHYDLDENGKLKSEVRDILISARIATLRFFSAMRRTARFINSPRKWIKLDCAAA